MRILKNKSLQILNRLYLNIFECLYSLGPYCVAIVCQKYYGQNITVPIILQVPILSCLGVVLWVPMISWVPIISCDTGMSFHIFAQNKLADIETLLIGGDLPICIVGQLYIKQLFSRLQSLVSQTGIRRKRWCGRLLYKLAARHQFTTFQYQPACLACTSKIECFSWIF